MVAKHVNKKNASLRSRRLEVVGERENRRALGKHARGVPHVLAINALLQSLVAPAATFSAMVFYC